MGIKQLIPAILFCQAVDCVQRCYIGVMDIYMNPNTLTMMDLLEVEYLENKLTKIYNSQVNTFKLIDCDKAHYAKEIIQ